MGHSVLDKFFLWCPLVISFCVVMSSCHLFVISVATVDQNGELLDETFLTGEMSNDDSNPDMVVWRVWTHCETLCDKYMTFLVRPGTCLASLVLEEM